MDDTIRTPARYQAPTEREDRDYGFGDYHTIDGVQLWYEGHRDTHGTAHVERVLVQGPAVNIARLLADDVLSELAAAVGCREWEV